MGSPPPQCSDIVLDPFLHPRQDVDASAAFASRKTSLSSQTHVVHQQGLRQRGHRTRRSHEPPADWHIEKDTGNIIGIGQSVDDHAPRQLLTLEKRRSRQDQLEERKRSRQERRTSTPSAQPAPAAMQYPRGSRPSSKRASSRESSTSASPPPSQHWAALDSLLGDVANGHSLQSPRPRSRESSRSPRESSPPSSRESSPPSRESTPSPTAS